MVQLRSSRPNLSHFTHTPSLELRWQYSKVNMNVQYSDYFSVISIDGIVKTFNTVNLFLSDLHFSTANVLTAPTNTDRHPQYCRVAEVSGGQPGLQLFFPSTALVAYTGDIRLHFQQPPDYTCRLTDLARDVRTVLNHDSSWFRVTSALPGSSAGTRDQLVATITVSASTYTWAQLSRDETQIKGVQREIVHYRERARLILLSLRPIRSRSTCLRRAASCLPNMKTGSVLESKHIL